MARGLEQRISSSPLGSLPKRGVYDTLLIYNLLISNVKKVETCVRGVGLGADGVMGRWCYGQMV